MGTVHISANWRIFYVDLARKILGNVVGTHPVPVRWAAGEEGSPAGGRAGTPPGTPARSSCPAGICPAQGKEYITSQGKEYTVLRVRDILVDCANFQGFLRARA
jgi:hypothetical protein